MSNNEKLPTHFWVIAIAAIVWNLLGVVAYLLEVTISEEAIAALPSAQQALYAAQPGWVTGAFAIAVFAGLGGSILLAIRNGLAPLIFGASLLAVVVQMAYFFGLSDTIAVMGAGSAVMPSLVIIVAAALVWFSSGAKRKSWID